MNIKHSLLALIATILWGTAFPVIKISLPYISTFYLAGFRFVLASLLLFIFMKLWYNIKISKDDIFFAFIIGIFQSFIQYGLFFTALKTIPASKASVIVGISPIIAMVSAHVFLKNDKLNIQKIVSIVIGISGATLITLSKSTWVNGNSNYFEVFLILLSMISSAVATILIAKRGKINSLVLNCGQLFFGGFLLLIVGFITTNINSIKINFISIFGVTELALVSAISFSIWFYLIKKVKITVLNIWKSAIPLFGTTFSWIFLKTESFNLTTMFGVILVVLAIIIMNIRFNHLFKKLRKL